MNRYDSYLRITTILSHWTMAWILSRENHTVKSFRTQCTLNQVIFRPYTSSLYYQKISARNLASIFKDQEHERGIMTKEYWIKIFFYNVMNLVPTAYSQRPMSLWPLPTLRSRTPLRYCRKHRPHSPPQVAEMMELHAIISQSRCWIKASTTSHIWGFAPGRLHSTRQLKPRLIIQIQRKQR